MRPFKLLNKVGSYENLTIAGAVLAPISDNKLIPNPWSMTLVVTRRCNSRCVMCSIWKEKTSPFLSLDQYERMFSENDFSFVRAITLTGGEPTLRPDLPQIFELVVKHMPNIDFVLLATSGLNTRRTIEHVSAMLEKMQTSEHHIKRYVVQISVDGIGEVHDQVRGIPGFFERTQQTIHELEELKARYSKLQIVLSSVLMPLNIQNAEAIASFADQRNLPIHFSPVIIADSYYSNFQTATNFYFKDEESKELALDFFRKLGSTENSRLRFYYQDMVKMIQGENRHRRCMMGFYGFVLENDSSIYPCLTCERRSFGNLLEEPFNEIWFRGTGHEIRHQLRATCCPTCTSSCWTDPVNVKEIAELAARRLLNHR